jgi:hypothetical protein
MAKSEIMEILRAGMASQGKIAVRRCGEWRENEDRGWWLEAVDIPKGEPRYLQVSPAYLHEEEETKPLGKGLIVYLVVDEEELLSRIN